MGLRRRWSYWVRPRGDGQCSILCIQRGVVAMYMADLSIIEVMAVFRPA